jgi:hypothetical protein
MTTLTERSPARLPTDSRISFRQPVSRTGSVDAGWWPRSDDLTAELPALLDVLWTAARDMRHVIYNLEAWKAAPRRMVIEGKQVRVGGYHHQNPSVLTMSDAGYDDSIDILVVPFDTDPAVAGRMLGLASEPGNTHTPEQMIELAKS